VQRIPDTLSKKLTACAFYSTFLVSSHFSKDLRSEHLCYRLCSPQWGSLVIEETYGFHTMVGVIYSSHLQSFIINVTERETYSSCISSSPCQPKTFATKPVPGVHCAFSISKSKGYLKSIYCNDAEEVQM